jgi:hypothetical protein
MNIRPYNPERDREAAHRIWQEVHWHQKENEELMDHFITAGRVLVADIDDTAECMVTSAPGQVRYLQEDLRLSAVTGVTTSRIARKQGFARRLTAELIAADVREGAQVCALSMFEQGYYNQLGFGTGGYEHMLRFDPADLMIEQTFRVPKRLTKDDWELVYAGTLVRHRGHGGCNLLAPELIRLEMGWTDGGFGLGYSDGPDGALTHFFWASGKEEFGPYSLRILAYQTYDQLLELLALLKSLGDQVRLVSVLEPPEIQIQDLIRQPFRGRMVTRRSSYEQQHRAMAFWQMRICDLPGCLAQTHLRGDTIQFNLSLHDPIEDSLDASAPWRGITGDYMVTLGPESEAKPGPSAKLPTLTASVGAFTRLWLGIRPATGLAVTDDLNGPVVLLEALDEMLRLPPAHIGWDF